MAFNDQFDQPSLDARWTVTGATLDDANDRVDMSTGALGLTSSIFFDNLDLTQRIEQTGTYQNFYIYLCKGGGISGRGARIHMRRQSLGGGADDVYLFFNAGTGSTFSSAATASGLDLSSQPWNLRITRTPAGSWTIYQDNVAIISNIQEPQAITDENNLETGLHYAQNNNTWLHSVQHVEANIAPVVGSSEPDLSIPSNTTGVFATVAGNMTDANNDTLTYSFVTGAPAGVTMAGNGDISSAGGITEGTYPITYQADDGNGGTVQDTFTLTVTAAVLALSIDNQSPAEGDTVTLTTDGTGPYTLAYGSHTISIDSQNATTAAVTWPDIKALGGAGANLGYGVAHDLVLTDTSDARTATISVTTDVQAGDFHQGIVTDLGGIYTMPEVPAALTDEVFMERLSGTGSIDVPTGAVPGPASVRVWIRDNTDGLWGAPGVVEVQDPALVPQNTVVIDSLTPSRTSAVVEFSYSGTDITGFEYRLDSGTWSSASSPLTITGLTEDTSYLFNVRPVNQGVNGQTTSQNFTTSSATDTTPTAFSFAAQNNVARSIPLTSSTVTVTGVDPGVDIPISVTGGEYSYSTDGGSSWSNWTTAAGNVRLNYQVRARHTSSNEYSSGGYNGTRTTNIVIGGVLGAFTSTTLADTTPPVINLTGGNISDWPQGQAWVEPGYSATDNADGNLLLSQIDVSAAPNVNVLGQYVITYTATDLSGNSSSTTRTVQVVAAAPSDTTPPVISLVGGNVQHPEGDPWVDPGYSATDETDGVVPVNVSGTVNVNAPGQYTLTYTATDAAGNTATATRVVNVVAAVAYPLTNAAPESRTFTAERMEANSVFFKQPEEIMDYDFDLTEWLTENNDTLPSDNTSVQIGGDDSSVRVEQYGVVSGTNRVKVWLSGGTPGRKGASYPVELTVITSQGRTARFMLLLVVVDLVV